MAQTETVFWIQHLTRLRKSISLFYQGISENIQHSIQIRWKDSDE
jgi:hypothetical protein